MKKLLLLISVLFFSTTVRSQVLSYQIPFNAQANYLRSLNYPSGIFSDSLIVINGTTRWMSRRPPYTGGAGINISTDNVISSSISSIPIITNSIRALNSSFTVSSTKAANVAYSVSLSVTNPLLAGSSTANAFLEYSVNSGTTWLLVSQASNSSAVGVAVAIAITNVQTSVISGVIPANALVRLRTTTTGTGSATFIASQEVVY